MKKKFRLTKQHILLLRAANVTWDDSMYDGAAGIDIKRPYGDKHDVAASVAFILTGVREELSAHERLKYTQLHQETATALAIVLATGQFKPGTYVRRDFGTWTKI